MGDSFWGALNCCNPGKGEGAAMASPWARPGADDDVMNNRQGVLPPPYFHPLKLTNPQVLLVSLLAFFPPPRRPLGRIEARPRKRQGREMRVRSPLSVPPRQTARSKLVAPTATSFPPWSRFEGKS